MKISTNWRSRLFLPLLLFGFVGNTFAQVVFSETFDNPTTALASWTIIDGDGNSNVTQYPFMTDAWIAWVESGDSCITSTSWYDTPGTSDDWAITPAINVTANNVLKFETMPSDVSPWNDGCEVWLTTTGTTISDFTTNGTLLTTISGELNDQFHPHIVSLASYSGQTVYIGFRNNNTDMNLLFLDDVIVEVQVADDASITNGSYSPYYWSMPLSQANYTNFACDITNNGQNSFSSQVVNLDIQGGTYSDTYTTGTVASASMDNATFSGTFTPSAVGVYEGVFNTVLAGDLVPTNDYDSAFFAIVDDSIYSQDLGFSLFAQGWSGGFFGTPGIVYSQKFEVFNTDTVTSITADHTFPFSAAGETVQYHIYNTLNDTSNGALLASTIMYTIQAADTGDANAGSLNLAIPGGVVLNPGVYVMVYDESDAFATAGMHASYYNYADATSHIKVPGALDFWADINNWDGNSTWTLRANFGHLQQTSPTCTLGATASPTNATTTGGSDGTATAIATGAQSTLSYAWTGGGNTATISGLSAGTYCVTITDAILPGCTATTCVTVSELAATCTVMALGTNVTCNGNSDAQVSVGASTGSSPYTYDWGSAGTGMLISGLAPGVYTVVMTDAASCTATDAVTVTEPNALVASTMVNNHESIAGASDGSATASAAGGNGGFSYAWSNGGSVGTQMGLAAGTYTVTVSDALGCTDVASVTINPGIVCAVTVTASSTVDNCMDNNGTATAMATGGATPYNYMWNVGGMSATVSGLMGGNTYMVTAVDAIGCSASTSVSVTGTPGISNVMVTVTDASGCGATDGTATAVVMGGTSPYTYSWFDTGMNTYGTSMTATGLGANIYGVDVTDANGCTEGSGNAVNAVGAPSVTVSGSDATCNGGTDGNVSATVSGGASPYTYNWLDFDNSTTYATETVSGLGASTYLLTVTDNGGCSSFAVQSVDEPDAIMANANVMDLMCNGDGMGAIMTMANGGTGALSYMWSNSETTTGISGLAAGTYGLTITDASMCTNSWSYTVSEPAAVNAGASATDESTAGANDGTATAAPTGGTGGYSYNWNTGDMVASLNNLAPNAYDVTVTDANGCTDVQSVTVYAAGANPCAGVTITASANATDESAAGASDGTATVTGGGSTSGYTYNWSNGATSATATGLTAGGYTVTVTDVNGCGSAVASATVNVAGAVSCTLGGTISGTNATTNGGSDGTATTSLTGTQGTITYTWDNGGNTASLSGLTAGTYCVTVSDDIEVGCEVTGCYTVTEPVSVEEITSSISMKLYPNPNNGNFTVTVSNDANYTVVVRNVIGQQVEVAAFNGTAYEVNLNAESGVYFVTVIGEGFEKTEKVIVR